MFTPTLTLPTLETVNPDWMTGNDRESRVDCLDPARSRTYIFRMRKGPIGTILTLAALVIVLLLAAKAWKTAFPAAAQALKPNSQVVPDHGDKAAGEAVRSGNLPNLKTTGERTDQHIQQVKEASSNQD